MSNLNETLKNAINVGNLRSWDQVTKLFEDQEAELRQEAADIVQARLQHYEKRPPEQQKMYAATVSALTYTTQLVTCQSKKSQSIWQAQIQMISREL